MISDLSYKDRLTVCAHMCQLDLLCGVLNGIDKLKSLKTPLKSILLAGIPTAASY